MRWEELKEKVRSLLPVRDAAGPRGGLTVRTVADGETLAPSEEVRVPRADIWEREDALEVIVDLPGVDSRGVEVLFDGQDTLVIRGAISREDPGRPLWREWEPGAFYRAFRLPPALDGSRARSQLRDGVLRIQVPRRPGAQPRRIPVRA